MRVLLLNPPYLPHFIRSARWTAQSISGSDWYPIWLAYCTGLLEKHGHEARLVDALAEKLSAAETIELGRKFRPELAAIYTSTDSLASDSAVAEGIKTATGSYTVLVGPWCSISPEEMLTRSAADALAVGEFDYTVLELAEGKTPAEIKGLLWKEDGRVMPNPLREPVPAEQLEEFPFVTDVYRRHLNLRCYRQASQLFPFVDLFTGRGCPWGLCTFCLWPHTINKGASYRPRRIEGVIEELKFVKQALPQVKEVFIQDDTLSQERARELAETILSHGLRMTWSCYSRPNLDYDTLSLMRRAGCRCLHVGYESADLTILKNIKKGVLPGTMERFTRDADRLGFIVQGDFIVGLPGETVQTIKATIEWAKRQPIHGYQFTTPKAYPTTPFHAWCLQRNALKDGQVSYEGFSSQDISYWTRRAIRECHLNLPYLWRMMKRPTELWRLLVTARYVVPEVFR